jgi:hypothetical protein
LVLDYVEALGGWSVRWLFLPGDVTLRDRYRKSTLIRVVSEPQR